MTRFDALADQVAAALNVDDAILDGEIIAADETGRPVFVDLLRGTCSPSYVAFDLLCLNGIDLRSFPLSERRRALQAVLPKALPILSEALSVEGRGRELFEICTNDLEGVVAKRLADPYDPRVRWLKIKNRDYSQKEGRGPVQSTAAAVEQSSRRRGMRSRYEPGPPMTLGSAAKRIGCSWYGVKHAATRPSPIQRRRPSDMVPRRRSRVRASALLARNAATTTSTPLRAGRIMIR
jgi:ATP dependent DNA ligase domain